MRIPYKKKITNANTTYCQLNYIDRNKVLDNTRLLIELDDALQKYNHPDSKILNSPNPRMPQKSGGKYGSGRNSARSMCEGTLDNFKNGQYDLSLKTIAGLTESFRVAHNLVDTFEEVEFYEGNTNAAVVPMNAILEDVNPNSTFSDLFEIVITASVRKK